MKIHEYQAKELFKKYGIPIPEGAVAHTPDEAHAVAANLGGFPVVVKAQIHAGGPGQRRRRPAGPFPRRGVAARR